MESTGTRISDTERDDAVAALTRHVASGRLDIAEFDHRAALAYAATTRADLAVVFSDLTADTGTAFRVKPGQSTVGPDAREWLTWAAVGVLCVTIWAVTSVATGQFIYPWPIWVFGPWGLVLTFQRVTGKSMGGGCSANRRTYRDGATDAI